MERRVVCLLGSVRRYCDFPTHRAISFTTNVTSHSRKSRCYGRPEWKDTWYEVGRSRRLGWSDWWCKKREAGWANSGTSRTWWAHTKYFKTKYMSLYGFLISRFYRWYPRSRKPVCAGLGESNAGIRPTTFGAMSTIFFHIFSFYSPSILIWQAIDLIWCCHPIRDFQLFSFNYFWSGDVRTSNMRYGRTYHQTQPHIHPVLHTVLIRLCFPLEYFSPECNFLIWLWWRILKIPSQNWMVSYPSSMTQWSSNTQLLILTILPTMQCRPMTDFLMVVRSLIWVDSPMIESAEICAFWSIKERSAGILYVAPLSIWKKKWNFRREGGKS